MHNLCSEQLSHQHHYDFNLRTIKVILKMSCHLKRIKSHLSETEAVLRAIIDVNLPKLVDQDIVIFKEICTQIFPLIHITEFEECLFTKRIETILEKNRLRQTPYVIEKIKQIYYLLGIRNGVIIVGDSMSGKTTAWKTLAETLKDLKVHPLSNVTEYDVNFRIINPKSTTLGQFFGQLDSMTQEWCDGVLAKTFREMVLATMSAQTRAWIIFDGPVDPLWIESLHTLLDDNRKLSLASGEMIEMTRLMSIIFETADLENASPATVSRCGIVYLNQTKLGWEALHASFVNELKEMAVLSDIYITLFAALADWLIPAILTVLQECSMNKIFISALHQYNVRNFFFICSIFKIIAFISLQIFSQFFRNFLQRHHQLNLVWFQQTFLYCLVWAYGSTLLSKWALSNN